ncbi:hypothetical protein BGZ95_002255 [Linnemannia exigua]|uniref:Uncharacterized protein n=1 Tax=Linnemannia exigua TaxID=604196 RepID=A0AAD4D5Q9_9FUNG|nr:hypothetical protein BGZ95_002255 [Linnemannia exigua]
MRFSTILASVSLAALASAATFSTASTSSAAAATNTTVPPQNTACFECLMNTFLQAVPACKRSMLDNIGSNVRLDDQGKACVCPVSSMAAKPEVLAPCLGPQLCSTNFTTYTTDIFVRIGQNNNCASYNAVSTPLPTTAAGTGADKPAPTNGANHGMDIVGGKLVALTALLAMAVAGAL